MYRLYCLCGYHSSAAVVVVVVVVYGVCLFAVLYLSLKIPLSFVVYCCCSVTSVYSHAGVGSG